MSFKSIIDEIENNLNKILDDLSLSDIPFSVEPAKPGFGDASSNIAFLLAKYLKKKPRDIALLVSEKYSSCKSTLVLKSEAHPSGYLNFFADWEKLNQLIISESVLDEYGCVNLGHGLQVVVEHTSVNPNKALHIGHIRNIIIGDVISRILVKSGHDVKILNYIDDSGLQVADIIVGFKHLGFDQNPPDAKKFDHYCGDDVYVKTTEKYESDPTLQEIRKNTLKELENEHSDTAKFADNITKRVLSAQLETCWNLGVYYDCLNFESQIIRSGLWKKIFENLKDLHIIEYENEGKNTGCWTIKSEENEEDKVLVRSNGTATYIAKDIPYAVWKLGLIGDPFNYIRYEKNQPSNKILWQTTLDESPEPKQKFSGQKVITVIDSRQTRLQKIIISLIRKLSNIDNSYLHLSYESVTLSPDTAKTLGLNTDGKQAQMSGRKGLYVNADSVYSLLQSKTIKETQRRHPDLSELEIETIAHQVTVGALRYEMIKQDLDKIISFDLIKSLSLEGDTASYIQYAHARAARILEKSESSVTLDVDFSLLSDLYEKELIKMIGLFDIQVIDAAKNLSPKVISRYCHDLAVAFNSFYEHVKVLGLDEKPLEDARLCLVNSFKNTVEKSLDILGISAPSKM